MSEKENVSKNHPESVQEALVASVDQLSLKDKENTEKQVSFFVNFWKKDISHHDIKFAPRVFAPRHYSSKSKDSSWFNMASICFTSLYGSWVCQITKMGVQQNQNTK